VQIHIRRITVSELTRRRFVQNSAGTAAGLTALGALLAGRADADVAAGSSPIVAYISDPSSGEITLMAHDGERTIRDRQLAAQIARAAG
jgi:hypothetical protein